MYLAKTQACKPSPWEGKDLQIEGCQTELADWARPDGAGWTGQAEPVAHGTMAQNSKSKHLGVAAMVGAWLRWRELPNPWRPGLRPHVVGQPGPKGKIFHFG